METFNIGDTVEMTKDVPPLINKGDRGTVQLVYKRMGTTILDVEFYGFKEPMIVRDFEVKKVSE
jgi:hypothetical protein